MLDITRLVGTPTAGEVSLVVKSKYDKGDVDKRGIILCHGYNGIADSYNPPTEPGFRYEYEVLAAAGLPVFIADFGGSSTWGNDAAIAAIQQGFDYLTTLPGVKSDKVVLFGVSMGNLGALNWAKNNSNKVAAYVGVLPAVNLAALHDDVGLGLAPTIEAAYGGAAGYEASKATHDPMLSTASYSATPIKLWYSPDDPVTPPWMATNFVLAVGSNASAVSMSGATGHSDTALNPYDVLSFVSMYA